MSTTPLVFAQKIESAATFQASESLEENIFVAIPTADSLKIDGVVSSSPPYEATWINAQRVALPTAANQQGIVGINYYSTITGDAASVVDEGEIAVRVSDTATVANIVAGSAIFVELGTGRACLASDAGAGAFRVGTALSDVRAGLGYVDAANSGNGDPNAEGVKGLYPFDGRMANRTSGDTVRFYVLVKIGIQNS